METNNSVKRAIVSIVLAFSLATLVLAIQSAKNEKALENQGDIQTNATTISKDYLSK